jgi:predicted acyltransferase
MEKSGRLISLDVLRGLAVVGMILVNTMTQMHRREHADVFQTLMHTPWDGLAFADVVFPAFLMMVGVSIPLALRDARLDRELTQRILARGARLVILGLILGNYRQFQQLIPDIRLFGVLQRIGLVYVACALLFLTCTPKIRLGAIVGILLLYWPLTLLPSLDGLATDLLKPGHNFPASVDRFLSGPDGILPYTRNYVRGPEGYDEDGLLGTLPAIALGLIGVAIGELLRSRREASRARTLTALGAAMLAVGWVWSLVFPVIMGLWTSSYVLVTAGITTLALAGLHAWLDRPLHNSPLSRLFATFFVAFGINAIAAYTLHIIMRGMFDWRLLLAPFHATRDVIGDPLAAFLPILIFTAFLWLICEYLRRRNWIIRI